MKTWSDITLNKFKLISEEKDDLKALSILEGKSVDELESMNLGEFDEVINRWSFIKETPNIVPVDILNIDGKWYTMIDLKSITVGEYETCQTYLRENNLEGFISVIYREVEVTFIQRVKLYLRVNKKVLRRLKTKPYNEESRLELMSKVGQLPYNFIYSASVFFSLLGANSIETFNNYLSRKVEELETDLLKNGVSLP